VSTAKRERWTEADVLALPAGEHDYLERKSGNLLADSHMEKTLAKALSALVNSGGGHLLLGVRNDGKFDGVEPLHGGRTPTREWLEQFVPNLLDFPLDDFRVHEVEPASNSMIPTGKVAIVIDIADSERAPHQSQSDKLYYVRVAGKSQPASHRMLEDIRNRLRYPDIMLKRLEVVSVEPSAGMSSNSRVWRPRLDITLRWTLENTGRLKANNCCVFSEVNGQPAFAPDRDFHQVVQSRPANDWHGAFWELQYPVYPHMETDFRCRLSVNAAMDLGRLERVWVLPDICPLKELPIRWRVYADNAPPKSGQTTLEEMGFSRLAPH
jgi:Putative DNA-binding domain